LGYEDLNDHDTLRLDPLLAALVGKSDPSGADRLRPRDRGKALAGKSTLNRLELTPLDATAASRYQKIVACPEAIERLFVDLFLQAHHQPPPQIVLDLDATDDPLHGHQEDRFFHGYYKEFCYLPLYIYLWRAPAGGQAAHGRQRRFGGHRRGVGAAHSADPGGLASGAHRVAGRQRLLSRRDYGLVRGARRGLPLRLGEEQSPG
jgi:hypothetical protein